MYGVFCCVFFCCGTSCGVLNSSIRRRAASCEYKHIAGYIACMVFITVYLFTMVRSCGALYSSIRCRAASCACKHISRCNMQYI
jgi:hypothetical protein